MALYVPRYTATLATTAAWRAWLRDHASAEPVELADIADVCASARCRARLLDPITGRLVGLVDSRGDVTFVGARTTR